jgi:hypothetical protein
MWMSSASLMLSTPLLLQEHWIVQWVPTHGTTVFVLAYEPLVQTVFVENVLKSPIKSNSEKII